MIVHIGYHKTGTTFLQNNVFPRLEGLEYVSYAECRQLFAAVYSDTTLEFDPEVHTQFTGAGHTLYSLERLVGDMGIGDYNYEIAGRLRALGFRKVIVTIRRQDKMTESIYRQYVQQGGVQKAGAYFADRDYFRWSYLEYDKLLARYVDLFGRENMLVLPQEFLRKDAPGAIKLLADFCGATGYQSPNRYKRPNSSLSYRSIQLLRVINHFTYNHYRRSHLVSRRITTWKFRHLLEAYLDPYLIRRLFGARKFVSSARSARIRAQYEPSNRRLAELFGLELAQYGYFDEKG